EQTGHQEGLGLQLRGQLGLASGGFQQLATQDGEADAGAQSTQTDHDGGGDVDEFHVKLLKLRGVKVWFKRSRTGSVGFFVGRAEVNDRQNHEDGGLQRDDQDVEDR